MSLENKSNTSFGLSVWAIRNSTIIYVLMAIFLILGGTAYVTMPRENFPEITETTIFISTPYPGNTAQDIERFVTDPLEEGIKGISNITEITSTSQDGSYYKNSMGLDDYIVDKCYNMARQARKLHIPITTFMIAQDSYLKEFVRNFTEANKGKAFFTGLKGLGEMIKKKKRLQIFLK